MYETKIYICGINDYNECFRKYVYNEKTLYDENVWYKYVMKMSVEMWYGCLNEKNIWNEKMSVWRKYVTKLVIKREMGIFNEKQNTWHEKCLCGENV